MIIKRRREIIVQYLNTTIAEEMGGLTPHNDFVMNVLTNSPWK